MAVLTNTEKMDANSARTGLVMPFRALVKSLHAFRCASSDGSFRYAEPRSKCAVASIFLSSSDNPVSRSQECVSYSVCDGTSVGKCNVWLLQDRTAAACLGFVFQLVDSSREVH